MKSNETLFGKTATFYRRHLLKRAARYVVMAIAILLLASTSALADIELLLIKGKRTINNRVSFTIEVGHEKNQDPSSAKPPSFIRISATFASPASGVIALDGKGIDRFDESLSIRGSETDITFGRHVVTLQVSAPAVATSLIVAVRGGVPREIIGEESGAERVPVSVGRPASAGSVEDRINALEQRVKQLEAEIEALKRERRRQ